MKAQLISGIIFAIICVSKAKSAASEIRNDNVGLDYQGLGRQLVEQGRTMVHHAVKRFMIILPAIFFKLGIAFTLLILIALAAINNGAIGFLLLVVGLSSVLARLQESRGVAAAVPYISPIPPYHHHHAVWDRSDSATDRNEDTRTAYYKNYLGQTQQYNPALTSYYAKYANTKV